MSIRKPISKATRFEVFKRDEFICQYCGAHPPATILHVDHIVAVATGGTNDISNLVTACESCNLGKGARPLNVRPEGLDDKARRIAEAEEQLAFYSKILEDRQDRLESDAWRVVQALTGQDNIARDRFSSILTFLKRLPALEVVEAAHIALVLGPRTETALFRYFCGVCWQKIKGNTR